MGEKDLYDYYKDAYKVISIDWTPKVAEEILTGNKIKNIKLIYKWKKSKNSKKN